MVVRLCIEGGTDRARCIEKIAAPIGSLLCEQRPGLQTRRERIANENSNQLLANSSAERLLAAKNSRWLETMSRLTPTTRDSIASCLVGLRVRKSIPHYQR